MPGLQKQQKLKRPVRKRKPANGRRHPTIFHRDTLKKITSTFDFRRMVRAKCPVCKTKKNQETVRKRKRGKRPQTSDHFRQPTKKTSKIVIFLSNGPRETRVNVPERRRERNFEKTVRDIRTFFKANGPEVRDIRKLKKRKSHFA